MARRNLVRVAEPGVDVEHLRAIGIDADAGDARAFPDPERSDGGASKGRLRVVGDAVRIFETVRRHPGKGGPIAASVILERALGGAATLVLAAVGSTWPAV